LFCSPPSPLQLTLYPSVPLLRRCARSCSSPEQKSKNLSQNDDNNRTDSVYHKNGRTSKYIATTITSRLSAMRQRRILMYCFNVYNIDRYIYIERERIFSILFVALQVSISITLYPSFFILRGHEIYKNQ